MIDQIFSWGTLLSLIGVIGFHLAGKKLWWAWYVNISNQVLWVVFAIVTGQLGFLIGAAFYTYVFVNNAIKWTKEEMERRERAKNPVVHNASFDPKIFTNALTKEHVLTPEDVYQQTQNQLNWKRVSIKMAEQDFERGVRQAMTWLRANYAEGDMPEWRSDGVAWIAEELAFWKTEHPDDV